MFDHQDRRNGDRPIFAETKIGALPEGSPEQTAASLLIGILGDLQHLIEQQFQLTRREIEDEIRQRAIAAAVFVVGAAVLFLGAIVLCLGLARLLHWASLPWGADPARLPLWACLGIVAAALAVLGGSLVHLGRAKFRSAEPHHNPFVELFQEHTP
jgi:hypothetical protein